MTIRRGERGRMKKKSRNYVMVKTEPDEKNKYKEAAKGNGFVHLASWFRWLAYKQMSTKRGRYERDERETRNDVQMWKKLHEDAE